MLRKRRRTLGVHFFALSCSLWSHGCPVSLNVCKTFGHLNHNMWFCTGVKFTTPVTYKNASHNKSLHLTHARAQKRINQTGSDFWACLWNCVQSQLTLEVFRLTGYKQTWVFLRMQYHSWPAGQSRSPSATQTPDANHARLFVCEHANRLKLKIWGRAQRDAARRRKSDWRKNVRRGGLKFPV